jgi:hypothetical protein
VGERAEGDEGGERVSIETSVLWAARETSVNLGGVINAE